jgi:uncharacterized RDD family membrane protein YckC
VSVQRALDYSYAGSRYLLGFGVNFFGIWVRGSAEPPLRTFPRTDEGWTHAWTEFKALEPDAIRLTHGTPLPEAEPEKPPVERLEPDESSAALATPARRLGAALVDASLLAAAVVLVLSVTGGYPSVATMQDSAKLLSSLWWLVFVSLLYTVPMTATRGQTVGKMALRIRVAALPDGGNPGLGRALVRWLVPVAMNIVPGLGLVAYVPIMFDPLRQGLHDKAAATVVVSVDGVRVGSERSDGARSW